MKDRPELIAINSHGHVYWIGKNPPRKWLLDYFGRQHSTMIYNQIGMNEIKHVGYIIAGEWLTIYRVESWKKEHVLV